MWGVNNWVDNSHRGFNEEEKEMNEEIRNLSDKVNSRIKYLKERLDSKNKELEDYKISSAEKLEGENMDTIARKSWIYKEVKEGMEREILVAEAKLDEAKKMAFHLENLLEGWV